MFQGGNFAVFSDSTQTLYDDLVINPANSYVYVSANQTITDNKNVVYADPFSFIVQSNSSNIFAPIAIGALNTVFGDDLLTDNYKMTYSENDLSYVHISSNQTIDFLVEDLIQENFMLVLWHSLDKLELVLIV